MVMDYAVADADGGTTDKNRAIEKYLKNNYGEDYKEYVRNSSRRNNKNKKRKKQA